MGPSRRGLVLIGAGVLSGCAVRAAPGPAGAARAAATRSALPAPEVTGTVALESALAQRHSVRAFSPDPLTREEIAQLMWAAQGVTHGPGYRTAPSGGALYPLELYAVTRTSTLHYLPDGHQVQEWRTVQGWQRLVDLTPSAEAVSSAPTVFVVAAAVRRTAAKYGGQSRRYVDLEAGHCAQNLLLQAVSLGLGAVTIGAFNSDRLARFLALPSWQEPIYLIPVGRPAG